MYLENEFLLHILLTKCLAMKYIISMFNHASMFLNVVSFGGRLHICCTEGMCVITPYLT